jgi:acetyltransferase
MFQSFSEEAIRYRFFQLLKDTPHEVRVRYCNIDYDREIAIVAELSEENRKRILGVGRLSIEPDGKTGELAFIIGDQWQGQGLGTKVVDYVLEIAKDMSVETVYAIMLPDNQRALTLTKKMGFKLEYLSDGTVKGVLDLREEVLNDRCPEPSAQAEKKETLAPEKLEKASKPEAKVPPL